MNKITIIQLLNKIANGEEVPKKIKYKGHIYRYQYEYIKETNIINYYHSETSHHHLIDGAYHDVRLNDKVEIIEEKEYEDIKECFAGVELEYNESSSEYKINQLIRNQKKLIDEVNRLKENK